MDDNLCSYPNTSLSQDASWVLPPSSPLKCTAPSDVYLLLKSSDFVSHDLSIDAVFDGCRYDASNPPSYQLELVLRKWYPIDKSREFRCFVREGRLIGTLPFIQSLHGQGDQKSHSRRDITTRYEFLRFHERAANTAEYRRGASTSLGG